MEMANVGGRVGVIIGNCHFEHTAVRKYDRTFLRIVTTTQIKKSFEKAFSVMKIN